MDDSWYTGAVVVVSPPGEVSACYLLKNGRDEDSLRAVWEKPRAAAFKQFFKISLM